MVLGLYSYSFFPQYGLYITLAIVSLVALAIYLVYSAFKYKVKIENKPTLTSGVQYGGVPTLPEQSQVFGYLDSLARAYPDPKSRARYLLSQPGTLNVVYGYLDKETEKEVRKLTG